MADIKRALLNALMFAAATAAVWATGVLPGKGAEVNYSPFIYSAFIIAAGRRAGRRQFYTWVILSGAALLVFLYPLKIYSATAFIFAVLLASQHGREIMFSCDSAPQDVRLNCWRTLKRLGEFSGVRLANRAR